MNLKELYSDLVAKLKKLFGRFDEDQKRFEKASNSEIARELGYSDAQFSRLINESATEGEYQRAIQNVDRILHVAQLENELNRTGGIKVSWKNSKLWLFSTLALALLLIFLIVSFIFNDQGNDNVETTTKRDDMLRWTFETSFVNPYTKLDELPDDCDFPCYKYQGKWQLKEGYKIPFFRERSGFHYSAVEVDMYARCMCEKSETGNVLEGYEYQKHEIWYDKRELPIDSFTYKDSRLKEFYQHLDFNSDDNFVKVATVHTFFRNEFTIDSLYIHRTGKVIGRDLEFVSYDKLEKYISSETVKDIENELMRISTNRLEDFSKPIVCETSPVPSKNIHLIKEGDEMSFDCQLTTNRMAMNYTKAFVLTDQYIKNICH